MTPLLPMLPALPTPPNVMLGGWSLNLTVTTGYLLSSRNNLRLAVGVLSCATIWALYTPPPFCMESALFFNFMISLWMALHSCFIPPSFRSHSALIPHGMSMQNIPYGFLTASASATAEVTHHMSRQSLNTCCLLRVAVTSLLFYLILSHGWTLVM